MPAWGAVAGRRGRAGRAGRAAGARHPRRGWSGAHQGTRAPAGARGPPGARGPLRGGAALRGVDAAWAEWEAADWTGAGRGELGQATAAEQADALEGRLKFGTAGLRGLVGPGFNRMNHVTVVQTSQGLCSYLQRECPERLQAGGVVVGFDGRADSRHFAELVTGVFAARGVPVLLFEEVCPTPAVAFAVVQRGCAAGVMVTASHNSKEYNGYKVYWGNGCQIIPPHDAGIAECIEENLSVDPVPPKSPQRFPRVEAPDAEVSEAYLEALCSRLAFHRGEFASAPPFVYTPLHGVGQKWVDRAFARFDLKTPVVVREQSVPDPDFPTVQFPNPEEGQGVWDLAISYAEQAGSPLCIANDPDADRLALCERQEDGTWRSFSGNEIGALLGAWILEHNEPSKEMYFLASTVSSKLLKSMAKIEGFSFAETLTGFKWLGNKALDLQKRGLRVPFAFEEAIGFSFGDVGNDKDGVAGACVAAEMANAIYARGYTLSRRLEELYEKYGYFGFRQGYFVADSPDKTCAVFQRIRSEGYPSEIGGFQVESVRDLGTGLDTSMPNGRTDMYWKEGDPMITFTLGGTDGSGTLTIRASGTEPKLKYYLEVQRSDSDAAQRDCSAIETAVASDIIRPDFHGLTSNLA